MFSLRKSVIGGGEDAYEEAFKMKKDEFDQAFDRYLKERFKPFRDKERPADYGRDLAPNREKTEFAEALSIAPSPSGDLIAVVTANRKDRELDIVLDLVEGRVDRPQPDARLRQGHGLRPHRLPRRAARDAVDVVVARRATGSPTSSGPRKSARSIIQNVLTRKIEVRIPMKSVDEPESPAFSPDGRTVAFAGAARRGRRHLHDRSRDQADRQPDERRLRRLRAELFAGRQVPHLQRARQRQPEAVPARSRHEEEDADHLRHRGRDRGAVHRRPHDRVLLDGHRSGRAARPGGREERQHLQHLDARPPDRRAAPVHRRRSAATGRPSC